MDIVDGQCAKLPVLVNNQIYTVDRVTNNVVSISVWIKQWMKKKAYKHIHTGTQAHRHIHTVVAMWAS